MEYRLKELREQAKLNDRAEMVHRSTQGATFTRLIIEEGSSVIRM